MVDLTHQFIAALHAGRVCLHPTDTLPGLTFDPTLGTGLLATVAVKGRTDGKPFLALAPTFAMARRCFAPLPGIWEQLLGELWPGPLSVIWTAAAAAPQALVAADGTIGLRVPEINVEAAWFRAVLERLDMPLPTTSVNRSGTAPAQTFGEAGAYLADCGTAYVPDWRPELSHDTASGSAGASTVIRLYGDGSFGLIRAGLMELSTLIQAGATMRREVHAV